MPNANENHSQQLIQADFEVESVIDTPKQSDEREKRARESISGSMIFLEKTLICWDINDE